ncbi:MAG: bifunctional sulfate adenylyltransferase/adenylylsulfate kinase [Legionellaceae bacterium]|nr:bifunctional sulfate adenylyltransferase/adenylylsulfate kinase [Legionellaceae bacterium]
MFNKNKNLLSGDLLKKHILRLTKRQLCDLECILNGTFAPLTGFLNREDYYSVCKNMRLTDGTLWPIPITLDIAESFANTVQLGEQVILTNDENTPLALLTVSSKWQPDKEEEALSVFGCVDKKHPGIHYLYTVAGSYYLGGQVTALSSIMHHDFVQYRHTPNQLQQFFKSHGWSTIVAFQTRNPIHRAHYELMQRASKEVNGHILIHPVVGMTREGDIDYVTRVHCYEAILKEFPKQSAMLSLLPLAMRMAGPREALWHTIIRKNCGVTHCIIGRDHAGPGLNSEGYPFYDPYAAQTLVNQYKSEVGIEIISFSAMVYVKEKKTFCTIDEVNANDTVEDISGTELRKRLEKGLNIPDWFTFPSIVQILQKAHPPKHRQGFTLFFTGLSGAGKSSIAKALMSYLQSSAHQRKITLLDGDIVRHHLSNGLGFSKVDRDTHIRRMGYVASEITKHGGIAICAAIAPYAATRQQVRSAIKQFGGFIEIHIATPLSVCKERDVKGLYQKAEQGLIQQVSGVDDPYEEPVAPEIKIDTSTISIHDAVQEILSTLMAHGYLLKEVKDLFTMNDNEIFQGS